MKNVCKIVADYHSVMFKLGVKEDIIFETDLSENDNLMEAVHDTVDKISDIILDDKADWLTICIDGEYGRYDTRFTLMYIASNVLRYVKKFKCEWMLELNQKLYDEFKVFNYHIDGNSDYEECRNMIFNKTGHNVR